MTHRTAPRPIRLILMACLLILALGGLFSFAPRRVAAARPTQVTADERCLPTDVVVLVDQSDSMRTVNDQDGRRFNAAGTIVDYLGNHAVWLCREQNIAHRVSVIGFGDDPAQPRSTGVDNPFQDDVATYIQSQTVPPLNDFKDWKEERPTIKVPIFAGEKDQLGATDAYSALLAARQQLDAWRAEPLGDQPRRQSIVIITDGEPCLFAHGCGDVDIYNINPDMDALESLTDPFGSPFPWRGSDNAESVYISLIAMSQRGGSLQDRFFAGWRRITQGHGGDVFSANDINTNMTTIVTDIMGPISGSGMRAVACNTDIWINPYTDNLILVYAFGLSDALAPGQAIINIYTDNEQFQVIGGAASSGAVKVTDYTQDENNEYYVFQPPLPGRYNLTYSGADPNNCRALMDIRIDSKPVAAEVITPNELSSYPATTPPSEIVGEPFRLEVYESVSAGGQERVPLVEFPDYPLTVNATVSGPDGHEKVYSFRKAQDGVYESTELIQSPTPGDYAWSLRATVETPNPDEPEIVVLEDSGRFAATVVTPFGFAVTQPADGAALPLNTVSGPNQLPVPIPVTVSLLDAAGAPADIDTYLTNDTDLFTAALLRGDEVIETVTLSRAPGSATEFSGELSNSDAGGVVAPGDYTVEVRAAWSPEKYNPLTYAPSVRTAAVGLSQFEVVPLELRVTGPVSTTVHVDNWLGALRGRVEPVTFHVEVVNAVTGDLMPLTDVLRDPAAAHQAAIVPPSGNPIMVPLTTLSNANFQRLVAEGVAAEGEESAVEAGTYQIKLDTAAIPLRDNFAWVAPEAGASFTRQDTVLTSPLTWRVIAGAITLLLLALLAWLVYRLTGGPSGQIVLTNTGTIPNREIKTFPLGSMPRVNRRGDKALEEHGVKAIKIRRGPDDDGRRTVQVSATDTEGGSLMDDVSLIENEPEGIAPNVEIVYKRRSS